MYSTMSNIAPIKDPPAGTRPYGTRATTQRPPLAGPSRTSRPLRFSFLMLFSTAVVLMPMISAISGIDQVSSSARRASILSSFSPNLSPNLSSNTSSGAPRRRRDEGTNAPVHIRSGMRTKSIHISSAFDTNMDKLMSLLNPWWRDGTVRPELAPEVRRDAFAQCWDLMDTRQIVAIGGLRRVGKTTLMYQMIEELLGTGVDPMDILYFSLDERREGLREVLDAYASSVGRDIGSGRAFVFLDEIQKHAGWTDELKLLYDALPDIKFVVSGSAALGLERRGRESLAGRMFFTRVEPLSFSEWLTLRGIGFRPGEARLFEGRLRPHLMSYMMTPFPEIVSWDEERARRYVKETIVDRVVYMDVPQEFGDADHALLEELIGIFFSNPVFLHF